MKELTFNEIWENAKNSKGETRANFEIAEDISKIINSIVVARINLNLTQKELADKCGLKQSAIARMESLKSIPRLDTVIKIAHQVNIRLSTETINAPAMPYQVVEKPFEEITIYSWGNICDPVLVYN